MRIGEPMASAAGTVGSVTQSFNTTSGMGRLTLNVLLSFANRTGGHGRADPRVFSDLRRWSVMPKGGHFAALEQPDLLAEDVRAFFGRCANRPRSGSRYEERHRIRR